MTDELEQLKKQQAELQRQIDVETAKFQDQLYELKKQQAEIKNQLVTKEAESQSQDSSANQTPEIIALFIYKGRVISRRNDEWKINDDFKRFKSLEEAERYIDTVLPPHRTRETREYGNVIQKSEGMNLMTVWGLVFILFFVGMVVIFDSYKNKEPVENKPSSKNSINKKTQEKNSTSVKNENLIPYRKFTDVTEAAGKLVKRNPDYLNYLARNVDRNTLSVCSALGAKVAAFSIFNPKAIDGDDAKTYALMFMSTAWALPLQEDKSRLFDHYTENFKPLATQDLVNKYGPKCEGLWLPAKNFLDKNDLIIFWERPYIN